MSRGRPAVLVAVGTRPEAIKLSPVVLALRRRGVAVALVAMAQHRDLLDAALSAFGLEAQADLGVMRRDQSPRQVLARVLRRFGALLDAAPPGLVVVQGDTTSALGAALAASRRGIPVAHVEAGLRTHDRRRPWPEEGNRVRIDAASTLLFPPTALARRNLLSEGLGGRLVRVTGNTGVDALRLALRSRAPAPPSPSGLPARARFAVVTLHRRESFGRPLAGLLKALEAAAERCEGLWWVFPVHPNPRVGRAARRWLRHPRILRVPPLGYPAFARLLRRAEFLVTDSGGIQEEAPSLGKPVLVLRDKTERPELLRRGGVLAGTSGRGLTRLLERWARGGAPKPPPRGLFGDGRAAERVASEIARWLSARARAGARGSGRPRAAPASRRRGGGAA